MASHQVVGVMPSSGPCSWICPQSRQCCSTPGAVVGQGQRGVHPHVLHARVGSMTVVPSAIGHWGGAPCPDASHDGRGAPQRWTGWCARTGRTSCWSETGVLSTTLEIGAIATVENEATQTDCRAEPPGANRSQWRSGETTQPARARNRAGPGYCWPGALRGQHLSEWRLRANAVE